MRLTTRVKMLAAVGAVLALLALGRYGCNTPSPAKPSRDSLKVERLDTLLALATQRADSLSALNQQLGQRLQARGDSLRRLLRARQGAALPPPPDTAAAALPYWKARTDTAEAGEAAALVLVDSLAGALTGQIEATGELTATARVVRDSLADLALRFGQLAQERRSLSRWALGVTGGAVGGLDSHGPFWGPGACAGATLSASLPLVHWRVGTTLGGCGAVDLTGAVRVGAGGSAGLSVRF